MLLITILLEYTLIKSKGTACKQQFRGIFINCTHYLTMLALTLNPLRRASRATFILELNLLYSKHFGGKTNPIQILPIPTRNLRHRGYRI